MKIRQIALLCIFLLIPLLFTTAVSPQPAHAATLTVANINDSGAGSLRQAIADATTGDMITFDAALSGQTILLASQLSINKTLTINGGSVITISGNAVTRVFNVAAGGNLTLNNLSIINGRLTGDIEHGAGIYNSGTLTINNSTLSGNHGQASITNGGGIYNVGGIVTLFNSTVSGNLARNRGGGIYNGGTVTLFNSTVSGNSTNSYGGGIFNSGTGGAVNISHTIIANNTAGFLGPDCYGTLNSQGYNLIEKTTNCTINVTTGDITGQDPLLGALADNGGPTLTHKPNSGSLAIDAGAASCGTTIDQRGAARAYNGNCDIGAVEWREIISVGGCEGLDLSGVQSFNFATSSNQVAIDLQTTSGLKCITVEEMGPGANHLLATGSAGNSGIYTDNWWHITGNINTGLDVDITLPYAGASGSSRVCKWPGGSGGYGWNCGDDAENTEGVNTVTRTGLASFSDWAVGDSVGPTAVSIQSISLASNTALLPILVSTLLLALMGGVVLRRRAR